MKAIKGFTDTELTEELKWARITNLTKLNSVVSSFESIVLHLPNDKHLEVPWLHIDGVVWVSMKAIVSITDLHNSSKLLVAAKGIDGYPIIRFFLNINSNSAQEIKKYNNSTYVRLRDLEFLCDTAYGHYIEKVSYELQQELMMYDTIIDEKDLSIGSRYSATVLSVEATKRKKGGTQQSTSQLAPTHPTTRVDPTSNKEGVQIVEKIFDAIRDIIERLDALEKRGVHSENSIAQDSVAMTPEQLIKLVAAATGKVEHTNK